MNVIMIFEMIGEVLAWYLEKYDVGGFKQYQDNGIHILPQRDMYEGKYIDSKSFFGLKPPFIFNLSEISSLDDIEKPELSILKDIYDVYTHAIQMYKTNIPLDAPSDKKLFRSSMGEADVQHMLNNYTYPEEFKLDSEFIERISANMNDDPEERDNYIWEFLKTHVKNKDSNGDPLYLQKTKIEPVPAPPTPPPAPRICISFNEAGVEYYNSKIKNKLHPHLIYTDKYFDIQSKTELEKDKYHYVLVQKPHIDKVPMISSSYNTVKTLCEEGLDIKDLVPRSSWMPNEAVIRPSDPKWGVKYDKETGLCKFTPAWCSEMGMATMIPGSYPGGTYQTCGEPMWETIAGFFITDMAARELVRMMG